MAVIRSGERWMNSRERIMSGMCRMSHLRFLALANWVAGNSIYCKKSGFEVKNVEFSFRYIELVCLWDIQVEMLNKKLDE